MNTRSFTSSLLSASLALTLVLGLGCIDVGEIRKPLGGDGPMGAAGTGETAGTGGVGGAADTSGGEQGSGAASGFGLLDIGVTERNCPGCARLSVPLSAAGTGTTFLTTFDPADLTGTSAGLRVCKLTGTSGTLRVFAQDGTPGSGSQSLNQSLAALSSCAAGFQTLAMVLAPTPGTFDPAQTVSIGLTVAAEAPGPWDSPTVLLVDAVRLASMSVGPWTFDDGVFPFLIGGQDPVPGSTLTWVGPDCPGCAALSASLTEPERSTVFTIGFGAPVDLTGATVTFRLCTLFGTFDSYVEPYARNPEPLYGGQWDASRSLTAVTPCLSGFQYLDLKVNAVPNFDPTHVGSLGLKLGSGTAGPWPDPALVLVDSIVVSSGVVGPWTFDLGASPFVVDALEATPGSTVSWFGQR
jgi:hypothetical protein